MGKYKCHSVPVEGLIALPMVRQAHHDKCLKNIKGQRLLILCPLSVSLLSKKVYFLASPLNSFDLSTFSTIIASFKVFDIAANGADTTSSPPFRPDNIWI
jgi:hypothetical protein